MLLTIKNITHHDWVKNAQKFYDYSYTHYWEYSKHAANHVGAVSENIAFVTKTGEVVGLCNIRIRTLPLGLGGIAYISGGPVLDMHKEDYVSNYLEVLSLLKKEYVSERGLVLRISQRLKNEELMAVERDVFLDSEFSVHSEKNATMFVNIAPDLPQVRLGLHQKWRNILKKSEKSNLEIISSDDDSLFNDFSTLFNGLLASKSFKVEHNEQFYLAVQKQAVSAERFRLSVAYKDGEAVSGILFSVSGDTSVYILGATNDIGRKLGAAYLLQWHVIKLSKGAKCVRYDLGGIDKINNEGVYKFKARMGGGESAMALTSQFCSGFRGKLTLVMERVHQLYKSIKAV